MAPKASLLPGAETPDATNPALAEILMARPEGLEPPTL
jgi:hypothetical protein